MAPPVEEMSNNVSTFWLVAGITLIVIGIAGFLTVADDLRHTGELFGVGSILALGIILVVVARLKRPRSR
jgi:hypothetical protein